MKRKILYALFAACALNSSLMLVSAASLTEYSGYVQKTQDIVTSPLTKSNTSVGTNWVEHVEEHRKLTCWIQKSGSRITDTKSYTDSGYQYLTYSDPINAKGKDVSLAVSTALTTLQKTYSFGSWSPDETK